jgi:tRNA(adenine34) deaminase
MIPSRRVGPSAQAGPITTGNIHLFSVEFDMPDDDITKLLDRAMDLAEQAGIAGAEPVGCVIAGPSGVVVGEGQNRVLTTNDPTAHAEVDALRNAGYDTLREGMVLVTSAEPCFMCFGAILLTPISRIIWATDWVRDSAFRSALATGYERERVHGLEVVAEPSRKHRAWTRRLLADFYDRTGANDLALLLRRDEA